MSDDKWIEVDGHAVPASSVGLDLLGWARWVETADRIVAQDTIGEFWVSTVFLGLDHQWLRTLRPEEDSPIAWVNLPPLLYETLVFHARLETSALTGGSYHPNADFQMRYHTREAAEEGHAKVIEALRSGVSVEALQEMEIEP